MSAAAADMKHSTCVNRNGHDEPPNVTVSRAAPS
jgi:hypothetical protein